MKEPDFPPKILGPEKGPITPKRGEKEVLGNFLVQNAFDFPNCAY